MQTIGNQSDDPILAELKSRWPLLDVRRADILAVARHVRAKEPRPICNFSALLEYWPTLPRSVRREIIRLLKGPGAARRCRRIGPLDLHTKWHRR